MRIVGLATPGVLVLGPVVDEKQEPGCRQAVNKAVEQGLGLGIDPVQILKDQQQRLIWLSRSSTHASARMSVRCRRWGGASVRKGLSAGRASRSASSAGTVSWRAGSSVSTCPVTLARMVRMSSRSSTWL